MYAYWRPGSLMNPDTRYDSKTLDKLLEWILNNFHGGEKKKKEKKEWLSLSGV